MTQRRLVVCLTVTTFAYMAAFAALYIDRVMPALQAIVKALAS